ncbi:MAG: leucyl aminopeptidase [Rhodospirillales bacterium]|nr:leucyl aminopeptidase [Rhodospirillales bacterium]
MRDVFCESGTDAVPLTVVAQSEFAEFQNALDARDRAWIAANGFSAAPGQILAIPGSEGQISRVLAAVGRPDDIYALAGAPANLPKGDYRFDTPLDAETANRLALGWGLGTYSFDRYRSRTKKPARLVWPHEADRVRVLRELDAIGLVRDLVNLPANDLGPVALAEAARAVAAAQNAGCHIVVGDELLKANYPAVYAVGRAAAEPPRVIDIRWGNPADPEITLIGKGITFDTGGLDIKTGSSMGLMKKDMGGAAHALALGQMIMEAGLKVRLRILMAVAENAVGPNANRPGDVIRTRAGLSVEIGNTDAEGRLVLADMLAAACEANPVAVIDFATLTGAARVALGPDLPALFATDALAADIAAACAAADDPVWRMPLWQPYRRNMDSKIADINNNASNSFAGAIHAALFLQEFVKAGVEWAHFDVYAWNATARPGRPVGGEAFALRGLFHMLSGRYGK